MSFRPAVAQRVTIAGPAGDIEAKLEESPTPGGYFAVVCHPHPLFGGTMDNKVTVTVARALQEAGVSSLRFNFRGVGASAGQYDEGRGETEDAIAVARWGFDRWPQQKLISAGFSFGAYVAVKLALAQRAARLITIAPAVSRFDFGHLARPDCPWLIVQGDADEVVDPGAVIAFAKGLVPPAGLILMPGVGHFFHGTLSQLRDAVLEDIRGGDGRPGR